MDEPEYIARLFQNLTGGAPVAAASALSPVQIRLAAYHGLVGLLSHSADPVLRDAAVIPYLELAGRQKLMRRHLRRILDRLHEADIPATVLKGPYIAESYAQPDVRTFSDIDLLVPAARLRDALDVMRADPSVTAIPPKKPRADKRDIPIHDPSGLVFNLDLHWDLFSYTQLLGCAAGATTWAWERAVLDAGHDLGPLWHLPMEARLAFLSTHAVLDHRFRLILFRDLAEVARNDVNWDAVVEFGKQWKLRSFIYLALRIATQVADAPVPEATLRELRPGSLVMAVVEGLLKRTDLVHFVGHSPKGLNLAIVLLHDSAGARLRLAARAPLAAPEWLRRVTAGDETAGHERRRQPWRVLHVLPVDIARGAQTYAKAMRDSLDSPEIQHRTATIFQSEPGSLDADIDLGVARGLGRRLGFSPTALAHLRTEVRRWGPDVVVAHGGEALKYAAFAKEKGTKLVYYKIGRAHDLLRNPARRFLHRKLVSRADLVAGVSEEMVEEARTLLGAPAERTVCIPNGRDPALFSRVARPSKPGRVRLLFVGHLTRTKRPDWFVKVIAALRVRGIDAQGVVVGDGPMLADLRDTNPPYVEFLGSRDDVPSLLAEGEVFLFTSLAEGEGMPGVLIEAGLAGLPVVSTDVPGARTVVEDGVTGHIVATDDLEAFIDRTAQLAEDPDRRTAMGAAARSRCLERFTLESSTDLWRRILFDLLER